MDLSGLPQAAFARDIFMFSFFTREMPLVDMAYLKKSDVADLKKIGQQLGLSIPLTTHCARHSNSHFLLKNK